jgi:L-ascorbate metabolism protein UlaG (beta-lactamase superfamily)
MAITIVPSERRQEKPWSIELPGDVKLTSTGAVIIFKRDFLPASFLVEVNGLVIYIDPLAVEDPLPADYIFITHDHLDHFSSDDIERIAGEETVIVCPTKVDKKLKKKFTTMSVRPGERFDLDGFGFETVPAYSIGFRSHPKKLENVGYILDFGGTRIYHTGDSDLVPEMESVKSITLALVPLDGGKLTMETDEAAYLINMIKPEIAVPMHYEMGKGSSDLFRVLVDEGARVEVME